MIEDFSHFEGVSPLPFPETFPSWPAVESHKSESLPGLDHGHDCIETPVLISYASVKEPPVLLSFGSGKEPFLSCVSGKDTDVGAFSDLAVTVSGTFSNLPPASFSCSAFSSSFLSSFTQSSSAKPSVTGSLFCETLLLPIVKQEPKEEKQPVSQPIVAKQPTNNRKFSTASELSDSTDSTSSSSSSDVTSSSEAVASSPDSFSSLTLLSLLDGDNNKSLKSERKTKSDRKTTKRDREEKKQPQKRGRKKRNSDDSDCGSEFDSNDSGCWAESKKERNKKAASNYRKRRKLYVNELEAKVAVLTEKSAKDRAAASSMTDEIQILKERIESLESLLAQHNVEVPKRKPCATTASVSGTGRSNKRARN